MAKADIWSIIHAERAALIADLSALSDQQWETTSRCDGWSVRDLVAHMTATAKMTSPSFFGQFLAAGFNFEKVQSKGIADERGAGSADALARFESVRTSRKRPPGPIDTMLGETIIHGEDIRGPLGIDHDYPTTAVVQVADFFKRSNLIIGAKKRIAGLRLSATDTEWSHGDGPSVNGPILTIVMAMTGRTEGLGDLAGDGVSVLAGRS